LNQSFKSTSLDYKEVLELAKLNMDKDLDLRPYMIDRPFTVNS